MSTRRTQLLMRPWVVSYVRRTALLPWWYTSAGAMSASEFSSDELGSLLLSPCGCWVRGAAQGEFVQQGVVC